MGRIQRLDIFLIAIQKVCDLRRAREYPRERIEHIERADRMEVGEHGVDPRHAEHARAEEHEDHRHEALSKAARGGGGAVHRGRDREREAHDPDAREARLDDVGFRREEREKLVPEQQEQPAEHRCGYCGIAERQQVALEHAARFARAVVLPDKARAGDVKRVHHGVDEVIHIARRGVALDDDGAERIDARLNEEVCDREDRVLQTCRHADRQRVDGLVLVEADLF